jgi:hypothetical protein
VTGLGGEAKPLGGVENMAAMQGRSASPPLKEKPMEEEELFNVTSQFSYHSSITHQRPFAALRHCGGCMIGVR